MKPGHPKNPKPALNCCFANVLVNSSNNQLYQGRFWGLWPNSDGAIIAILIFPTNAVIVEKTCPYRPLAQKTYPSQPLR